MWELLRVLLQEHTENHADGPPTGGCPRLPQSPPLRGTLTQCADGGPLECGHSRAEIAKSKQGHAFSLPGLRVVGVDRDDAIEGTYRSEIAARALPLYLDAATDSLYGTPSEQWVEDIGFRCPAVAQSIWHTAAGQAAYVYELEHVPAARRRGNTHAQDVPYVFGSLARAEYAAADTVLSDLMQTYWTNFAKTGNPNGPGVPRWPTFDATSRRYVAFTENGARPADGLRNRYCDLFLESTRRLARSNGQPPAPLARW